MLRHRITTGMPLIVKLVQVSGWCIRHRLEFAKRWRVIRHHHRPERTEAQVLDERDYLPREILDARRVQDI